MGLTFGDSSAAEENRGRLRRVPDYGSRPVKLKLFAMLAALMLVLFVADKARDPASWKWYFAFDQQPPAERIDNRVPPRAGRTAGEAVDTVVIASGDEPPPAAASQKLEAKAARPDPAAKAFTSGIREVWKQLSMEERTLLFRMLEGVQDRKIWPEAERPAAEALLMSLDQKWTNHHVAAHESLAELTAEEQARWTAVLREVNQRFSEQVHAPLSTFAAGQTVLPDQQQLLSQFLDEMVAVNLSRVQDDTLILVPEQNQIWHHFCWLLRRTGDADLTARSRGEVAYAQLYRQPDVYRGQVVTVRGAARRAYRVQASRNHLGIKEYYVFWVQPFESADTPLVVYALEVPRGFPALKDRDRDGGMTALNDDVVFHGILVKRCAYAGEGGSYNAPLLLARSPLWTAAPLGLRETESFGGRIIWQAAIAALAISTLIAVGVYWTLFRKVRLPSPPKDELAIAASLRKLQDGDVLPSPEEALRQFERQARNADGDVPPV